MAERLPAMLLAVHLIYLLFLPSVSGKAVSAVGCVVTLGLTLGPVISRRFAARVQEELGAFQGTRPLAVLAFFGLPLLSFVVQPQLAFWRLDGRAMLIMAWLAALSYLLAFREAGVPASPASHAPRRRLTIFTQLFILWSSLFWLMIVWDVGVGRAVLLVTREDRLTMSFALWETRPAREHLFLVWLSREDFLHGVAYTNHLHPFLFFMYGCSKLVQLATGLPLYVGRNVTPFAMAALGAVAFSTLVARLSGRSPQGGKFHATLFIALGLVLTEWHFWAYPLASNFDTIFPIVAYLTALVWASAYPRICRPNAFAVTASLVLFAAFGWLYTPVIVLAVWCVFGRMRSNLPETLAANRPLARASIVAITVGVTTYALPLLLVALKGYGNVSSSFLYRAGLDGDTQYFQHAAQAVFHPYAPARTVWSLFFPASVPLAIAAGCAWAAGRLTRRRLIQQTVFLLSPYLFSLALFPQSLSIHPYLYDTLLLLPIALIGSSWALSPCVQSRLQRASVLAGLLLAAILIMGNLIGIAQRMAPLIGG